ncbi:MAG: hypothetical protein C5B55_11485 [Blastocatellia bacterium]|nr:MAG: hypothetical protein C5B55_11485 [Blastocatellia bacterium]
MSAVIESSNIKIREITEPAEMRPVEDLQREVWGVPDLDVVPVTHLVATKEAGGVLIGAYDGENLVGFVYGFPAFEHGQMAHHSHMLAVKPEYRNFDLGRRLKLAQREHVIAQGIGLMTWTFDPLQSLNAYFNFCKLGVVSDRYLPNFYGEDAASFLHQTGTDRLWISWFVNSDRVKNRISNAAAALDAGSTTPLVEVTNDGSPRRNDLSASLAYDRTSIEIPGDINSLYEESAQKAFSWREDTRWAFTEALNAGYVISGFMRGRRDSQMLGSYLLSKAELLSFR